MSIGFQQFAVVSAVLCGFAFAYFGSLLGLPAGSRAVTWAAAASGVAAACLIVSTLGASFIAVDASLEAQLPRRAVILRPWTALSFVAGIAALLASLACGGWQRSRTLGEGSRRRVGRRVRRIDVDRVAVPVIARGCGQREGERAHPSRT